MKTPQLDERQRLNRGRAGFISFWTVLVLLAADMVLTSCGVHWASSADQLLVVIVLGITVFSVLIVLSGAYFGRRAS